MAGRAGRQRQSGMRIGLNTSVFGNVEVSSIIRAGGVRFVIGSEEEICAPCSPMKNTARSARRLATAEASRSTAWIFLRGVFFFSSE